ncbi:hypothetical protein RND81_07G154500 [Saponaria officinalis]|uniref:F-box domain-containing protein n=1 Tax=Saponaria officinalis TaxID=3572 RepID=A0AAW1JR12_SAPOF
MASQPLPLDIISEIVSRLPIKPIFRFKTVSKSWHSMITSPKFIKLHLTKTRNLTSLPKLIVSHWSLSETDIDDKNINSVHLTELNHPLKHLPSHIAVEIDGFCNGVLCITPFDKKSVYLYNPSTKTHHLIPPFASSPNLKPYFDMFDQRNVNLVVFGFGYDDLKDDYIVLRLIVNNQHRESSVYSLRNDSWNSVDDNTSTEYRVQINKGVLVNETLHFSAVKVISGNKFDRMIKCFNIKTRSFSLIEIPKFDEKFDRFGLVMNELNGYFSILVNQHNFDNNAMLCRKLKCCDMWVRKQETWVKMFSIHDPESIGASLNVKPILYRKDGREILLQVDSEELVWYEIGSGEIEKVRIHELPLRNGKNQSFDVWTFVGSLVSLAKDEAISQTKSLQHKAKNNNESAKFLSKGFKLRL